MNGFILFVGGEFEQIGGWINYEGCYSALEDAEAAGQSGLGTPGNDWYHIVDTSTERIVKQVKK